MMKRRQLSDTARDRLITIGITAASTAAVTLLARNFIASEQKITHRIPQLYTIDDPQFERSMSQLLGPPIVGGNLVTPLKNGAQIFPAMLEAIESAQTSITFETFIYWCGSVADRFAAALAKKAAEGVKVHVLMDGLGCDCVNGPALRKMREAGVELELYHLASVTRINHRTHRKLLVIDGRLGFTGGVGIADQWDGNADSPGHWRDSHYKVEGPVVAQMQAAFTDNWMKTRAVVLHGRNYFPELHPVGEHRCQVFKSSPSEGSESARLMFLLSIAAARHSLKIANAYFVPDDLTTKTLKEAAGRGVQVEVIVPGTATDNPVVRAASQNAWGGLLSRGVRIYEFEPTMFHCKYMIIDDLWTSVGSANFDNRSFRLNDEANLNILGREVAATESRSFEEDKARSREVTVEQWRRRPLYQKFASATAALFRAQM